jgi:predicted secreted hydrolase
VSVQDVLGGTAQGFARAAGPRPFRFPDDHGPHPEYRSEWWYFTGNLAAPSGGRFGFQLTLFRFALTADPPRRESQWAASQVYMAHLAVTDVAAGRFRAVERLSRDALGLAGARALPLRVWVGDWTLESLPDGRSFQVAAGEGEMGLSLTLEPLKDFVLQGDGGLSQKSAEPGNASYYYSGTRLLARGTVTVGGRPLAVEGLAWMDREWSTSALGPDQVGWDWFALQLDDQRELMLYRLRRRDGTVDPLSKGSVVEGDGVARVLRAEEVRVEVLAEWSSPRDGTRYPARWRIQVPREGLAVEVEPLLADQEIDLSVRYWEGAVRVTGTSRGRPVSGYGYVELTGYAR